MEFFIIEQKRKVKIKFDLDVYYINKKWDKLKVKQVWNRVILVDSVSGLVIEDCVRFVCIFDTYRKFFIIVDRILDGDVLLYVGDFSNVGLFIDVKEFNDILGKVRIYYFYLNMFIINVY